jgi:3D (Asp-Asp-Asp) domain-containing protein
MRFPTIQLVIPALGLLLASCASRPLPKYEKPIARTQFQTVRTTAYTHTESDHRQYAKRNALGTTLLASGARSAAADWSRWPAGTTFRLLDTGELYKVDDYGWALSGTNTIDLYKPSRGAMNAWGVRRVNIEVLCWGDVDRSLAILRPRSKHAHVRRMINQIEDRYALLRKPVPTDFTATAAQPRLASAVPVARALPNGSPLTPFMADTNR